MAITGIIQGIAARTTKQVCRRRRNHVERVRARAALQRGKAAVSQRVGAGVGAAGAAHRPAAHRIQAGQRAGAGQAGHVGEAGRHVVAGTVKAGGGSRRRQRRTADPGDRAARRFAGIRAGQRVGRQGQDVEAVAALDVRRRVRAQRVSVDRRAALQRGKAAVSQRVGAGVGAAGAAHRPAAHRIQAGQRAGAGQAGHVGEAGRHVVAGTVKAGGGSRRRQRRTADPGDRAARRFAGIRAGQRVGRQGQDVEAVAALDVRRRVRAQREGVHRGTALQRGHATYNCRNIHSLGVGTCCARDCPVACRVHAHQRRIRAVAGHRIRACGGVHGDVAGKSARVYRIGTDTTGQRCRCDMGEVEGIGPSDDQGGIGQGHAGIARDIDAATRYRSDIDSSCRRPIWQDYAALNGQETAAASTAAVTALADVQLQYASIIRARDRCVTLNRDVAKRIQREGRPSGDNDR